MCVHTHIHDMYYTDTSTDTRPLHTVYVDIFYLLGGTAGCFLLVGTGGACFPDPPPSILCLLVGTTGGTDAQEVTKASGMDEGKRLITFLPNNTII
jgi:hypothetical protein